MKKTTQGLQWLAARVGFTLHLPLRRVRAGTTRLAAPPVRGSLTNRAATDPDRKDAKVLFIAPIYNYYPILVHALQSQTHDNWELLLVHDGPNDLGLAATVAAFNDERIDYSGTALRHNDWGHSLRRGALERIAQEKSGDYIVVTNADNYYAPGFISLMLNAFEDDTVAVYCDAVHSHRGWAHLDTSISLRSIDCGCVMVRREEALTIGWTSTEFAADWVYIDALASAYGLDRFLKVQRPLFVHN